VGVLLGVGYGEDVEVVDGGKCVRVLVLLLGAVLDGGYSFLLIEGFSEQLVINIKRNIK